MGHPISDRRPRLGRITALAPVLLALMAAGCGGGFSGAEPSGSADKDGKVEEVRFGALLTLTGAASGIGDQMKKTVDFAVAEINKDGGIRTMGGAKLVPVYGDSQSDPNAGVGETQRLIGDNVSAIVDQYPSAITIAASTVAERMKTPYIASISYADAITERGYKYIFQQQPKAKGIAQEKADFLDYINKVGNGAFKRVAIVHENTDYGVSIGDNLAKLIEAKGTYKIVSKISYPATAPSLDGQAAKLKASNPDIVFIVPYVNDGILWFKASKRFGLRNIPWVGNSIKMETDFAKAVGTIPQYELDRNIWSPDLSPEDKDLGERFKQAAGFDLSGNYALMYQAIHTLRMAIEQAKSTDREAIREALANMTLEPGPDMIMPWKNIDFNDAGVNVSSHGIVSQFRDGAWKTVWPEEYGSTKLELSPDWTK